MSPTRREKERVRTAKRRSQSSTRWLERQLNDPLVHEAKRLGYRARSVFKLQEIDERFGLLRRGARVVDLGAAPGSWTQYASQRGCRVVALDVLTMEPVTGADILEGDFLDPDVQVRVIERLGGQVDVVLSDIAAPATGQRSVDRLRAEGVGEAVLDFAAEVLAPGGTCVIKLLKGAEPALLPTAMRHFKGYRLVKPKATRSESSEIYLIATGRRETTPPEAGGG
jgi:23S rRNA (uridine2552-2'-O)-methyltransferase